MFLFTLIDLFFFGDLILYLVFVIIQLLLLCDVFIGRNEVDCYINHEM